MTSRDIPPQRRKLKPSEVYREAARFIEMGLDYSCCSAIRRAADGSRALADSMEDWFYFNDSSSNQYGGHWMVEIGESTRGDSIEVQNRRVLALCFMAAITKYWERGRK